MMMRAMEESKESTHNSKEAEDDDLFDVAILIDELRHEEVQYRMNSMQKLTVIGKQCSIELHSPGKRERERETLFN